MSVVVIITGWLLYMYCCCTTYAYFLNTDKVDTKHGSNDVDAYVPGSILYADWWIQVSLYRFPEIRKCWPRYHSNVRRATYTSAIFGNIWPESIVGWFCVWHYVVRFAQSRHPHIVRPCTVLVAFNCLFEKNICTPSLKISGYSPGAVGLPTFMIKSDGILCCYLSGYIV